MSDDNWDDYWEDDMGQRVEEAGRWALLDPAVRATLRLQREVTDEHITFRLVPAHVCIDDHPVDTDDTWPDGTPVVMRVGWV